MSPGRTPTFTVAGAGRSGTTGLVEGLKTHPGVFLTYPKEPHYYALHGRDADFRGPGDPATINRVAVTGRDAFLELFSGAADHLARGDGSVSTLYYAQRAVEEIRRINPDMRVVIILRNPVERAYSSYLYMRARGFEPCADPVEALEDEERRRADNWHHLWHYRQMSFYADGVRTLQDGLGRDQVGVYFYDDLSADYTATVSRVLRFLGLPAHPSEGRDVPRVNVSGTPRLALLQKAIVAATRNEVVRRTVKNSTSFRFRERIRRSSLQRSAVPPAVEEALRGVYDDDLAELATLISGDVPPWLSASRLTEGPA
jgi:hypothetical protein